MTQAPWTRFWVRHRFNHGSNYWAALPIAFLWLHAAPVMAQAGSEDSTSPDSDAVVVTGRRDLDDRFRTPASRVNINRRDIEALGANTIGDVLRQVPGLQVTTTASGGLEIRMRGMGTENTRILLDGVAVNPNNRNLQLPLDEVPADLIERIEVMRAPTAEFQGAAGGTLNIVLRAASPRRDTFVSMNNQFVWGKIAPAIFLSRTGPLSEAPPKPLPKPSAKPAKPFAKPAAGSEPAATQSALAAAAEPSWSYFLSFNAGERNNGNDTQRQTSTNTAATTSSEIGDATRMRNRFWTFTPRINGRVSASDRLNLRGVISGFDQDGRVNSNSLGRSNGIGLVGEATNPWNYERSFLQGAADWSHSARNVKWDSTLQLERSFSDYRINRNSLSTLGGATTPSNSFYNEERAERGIIAKTKFETGDGVSTWSGGAELEYRHLNVNSASVTAAATTPLDLKSSTQSKVLWGQYEIALDSIETSVVLGLRAREYASDVSTAAGTSQYSRVGLQPSLNSRTYLSDEWLYRFNLARISRNPRIAELAPVSRPDIATNSPNAPDYQGNPNLRPENTVTFDTGLERRLQGGGQAGMNIFVREQSGVIRRNLFLSGTRWVEQPANIGDATVWGLETDVRMPLTWAGLSRDWNLNANASLLNSRFHGGLSPGQRIPGQARYLANINIAKPQRPGGGWFGGGAVNLVGASSLNTPSGPGVEVSGTQRAHTQVNLFVGNVVPKVGFWRLNVFNITDYRQQRGRAVTNSLNGTVFTEHSSRTLTPRWFLTLGTRF